MSIANQVRIWNGDVTKLTADVLVIPTTSQGSFGSPWSEVVRQLGIAGPKARIAQGEIVTERVPRGQAFKYLAFAATVDAASPTTSDVVSSIGNALGWLTREEEHLQIATPLLGTGVGQLEEEASVRALVAGYVASARPEAELVIAVLGQQKAASLQLLIRGIEAEAAKSGNRSNDGSVSEPNSVGARHGESSDSGSPLPAVGRPRTVPTMKHFGEDARSILSLAYSARQATKSTALHTDHLAWALVRSGDPGVPETWRALRLEGVERLDASLGRGFAQSGAVHEIAKVPKLSEHVESALSAAWARTVNGRLITTSDVIYGLLSVPDCSTAERIREQLPDAFVLAGTAADTVPVEALAADRLDLRREVEMMTTVMLARKTPLPLAIGLFGNWGSGKSFFMAMMRERATELARLAELGRPEAADFCAKVRQIEFNAWHYADDDLWASLAATIFDGLVDSPEEEVKRQKADELGQAQRRAIAADERVARAEAKLTAAEDKADDLLTVGRSAIPTALAIVARTPDIESRLRSLGIDADTDAEQVVAAVDAARSLSEKTQLRWGLIRSELGRGRPKSTAIWAGVTLAAVLVFAAMGQLGVWGWVLSVLIGLTPVLGLAVKGANAVLGAARQARERRERPVDEARAELEQAQREQREAGTVLHARQAELERLRNRGQRLKELVSSARTEYGSRLSMLSQLRKDFEQLTWLLKPQTDAAPDRPNEANALPSEELRAAAADLVRVGGEPASEALEVERIVLYIDDLDRCSADVVVQVLRAINLLLAFPLFVVVVAVDGRWLEKSLRARHRDLLEEPRDYLEKIIQIPFVLQPLDANTYSALVESLVQPTDGEHSSTDSDQNGRPTVSEPPHYEAGSPARGEEALDGPRSKEGDAPGSGTDPDPTPVLSVGPSEIPMPRPMALQISRPEAEWLARIGTILTTPRSAKRMVNIYRMVRVHASDRHGSAFRADEGATEYRAVILLLAVLMGCSTDAAEVFDRLQETDGDAPIEPILRACLPVATAAAVCLLQDPEDGFMCSTYQRWLPLVRRFSYYAGGLDPSPEADPAVDSA